MRYVKLVVTVAGALLIFPACGSQTGNADLLPREPIIESRTIATSELPREFDESRTYYYVGANLSDPERMIVTLWYAGFHTTRAWQPLDNPMCMDPLGPTFTVELEVGNAAIEDEGFTRGAGRLFCATQLTEFTVSAAGS